MKTIMTICSCAAIALLIGCSKPTEPDSNGSTSESKPSANGDQYLVNAEPADAKDAIAARKSAKDGDEIVIVGRIGGNNNPWVQGLAAFYIVDRSLKACDDIPGDMCPKPWDYCCEASKLPTSMALVKVVGENGKLISTDARELLKVKPLNTVVIKGLAVRDDAGNLTVLANQIHIKKS